jgi:hypothetical protein
MKFMQKTLSVFITATVLAMGLSACTQEQSALNKPPGKYERTVKSTDSTGTTTERQSSTDVSVDEEGNKKAVVKSKTTRDPKGLFNKTTTSESRQVIEEK